MRDDANATPGQPAAGFPLRGLKGLWWEPEQYRGWPAFLQGAGYDFLMLCYTFCPETGLRWRQPFRSMELQIVGRLAEECQASGIALTLALTIYTMVKSKRLSDFLDVLSDERFSAWQHSTNSSGVMVSSSASFLLLH